MAYVMCINCKYFDKKLLKKTSSGNIIYPCYVYPADYSDSSGWYINLEIDCPKFIQKEQTNSTDTSLPIDEKILSNIDKSLSKIAYELRTANVLKAWEMQIKINGISPLRIPLENIIFDRGLN
ncbi:MAG: hypothetical protein ACYDCP_10975 [Thermoplasmataceae archaeon]